MIFFGGRVEETLSADGSVEFGSADQFNLGTATESLGEGGVSATNDTDGSELGDLFSHGEEVNDIEGLSLESAVKGCDNDNLALVGKIFGKLNNLVILRGCTYSKVLHQQKIVLHQWR